MTDECGNLNENVDCTDAQGEPSTSSSGVGGAVTATVNKYVARMPVDRYAREYNMNHKHRGLALIFNHEFFDTLSLKPRLGTNVDSEELRKALQRLDFEVSVHKDCNVSDIRKYIEKAASLDHSDNDCIAIAILSHGEHGYIYAEDGMYKLDHIWRYFTADNCPTLAGKPKLFFIQACQGARLDAGVMLQRDSTETDGDSSTSYKIPIHADFLFSYSTIPGFFAWRNTLNGSFYIQSLVRELNENGKKDNILTLLTFVGQRVAINFESSVPDTPYKDRQKQIPCVTSMLTRILRFTDKPSSSKAG